MANPFREDEVCLVNTESKLILSKDASESVKSAKVKGEKQSQEFIENCLVNGTKSLYDSISKNYLKLFRNSRMMLLYLGGHRKSIPQNLIVASMETLL